MKIVVLAKVVPDSTGTRSFDPLDNTAVRSGAGNNILSELDEHAVEEALVLRDEHDGEVVVITLGPEDTEDGVRKALQMGADRAVHIVDDAARGTDCLGTSLVLAKAIEHIGDADIVLTGMASTDSGMSVVSVMVAERLGFPHLGWLSQIAIDGRVVSATREGDHADEQVVAPLPVVAMITDHTNEPRYPSFKNIMAAKKRPLNRIALEDLGLGQDGLGHAGAHTSVDSFHERPPRQAGEVITDDGDGGPRFAEFLKAHGFATRSN